MSNQQPETLELADLLERDPSEWGGLTLGWKAAAELRRLHNEVVRLNTALKYEQDRSGRIGTHGPGCHLWGHRHYECLEREYKDAIKALKELIAGHGGTHGCHRHDGRSIAARAAIAKAEVKV